jgi:hypothetical protein
VVATPTSTQAWLPRPLVEGLVRATGDAAGSSSILDGIDAGASTRWESAGGLPAVAGVDELRAAVRGVPGVDPARRARLDALLALAANGPDQTIGDAARALGLAPTDRAGVRAALQARDLDVILRAGTGAGARRVQRVPSSFLSVRAATELASQAATTSSVGRGAGAAADLLGRLRTAGPRLAIVGGTAGAVIGAYAFIRHLGGASSTSAPAAGGDATHSTTSTGSSAPAPAPSSAEAKQRAKLVQSAVDLVGTSDLLEDGSVNPTVRGWKSSVIDGRPGDPNASWEIAFAAHVAKASGAPIGTGGKGAATALDLRSWAEDTGHFRSPSAAHATPGNVVLLVRKDAYGLTWHDVGIVAGPTKDGHGIVVIAGNRLGTRTATVDGHRVYVGSVGYEQVALDSTLAKQGTQIEGYVDGISKPVAVHKHEAHGASAEAKARAQIVARAKSQVGRKEVNGPNDGPDVDKYWRNAGGWQLSDAEKVYGGYWCAAFTSWLYNEQRMPYLDRDGDLSTSRIRQWAIDSHVWHSNLTPAGTKYDPKPGDLILFRGSGATTPTTHIGIVSSYDAKSGTIHTVEGNAARTRGSNNGDGVWEHTYHRFDHNGDGGRLIVGFVNVFDYYDAHPKGPK